MLEPFGITLDENEVQSEGFIPLKEEHGRGFATEVETQGFLPLKKASTFSGRSFEGYRSVRRDSFDSRVKERLAWDANPWKAVARTVSFKSGKEAGASERIREAVVVVDPFSTGALIAQQIVAGGRICVRVLSIGDSPVASLVSENAKVSYDATIQHDDTHPDQDSAIAETGFWHANGNFLPVSSNKTLN